MHLLAQLTVSLWIALHVTIIAAIAEDKKTDIIVFPVERINKSTINLSEYYYQRPQNYPSYPSETNSYYKDDNQLVATGVSSLTLSLNRLLLNANGGNVVFSPLSISSALALALLGAERTTLKELADVLGFTTGIEKSNQDYRIYHEQLSSILNQITATSGEEIDVANAVFVQSDFPIRPSYKSKVLDLYRSYLSSVDFKNGGQSAKTQVNQWVEKSTRGKIKTILEDIPPSYTKFILASALYFKAKWLFPFSGELTMRRPFYVNGYNSPSLHKVVTMYTMEYLPYYKDPTLGCEIVGLPYIDRKSTMYVIVPFQSSKEKLLQFGSKLTVNDLENLVSKTEVTETIISFPKMEIESTFDLTHPLESLGLRSLFNPQQADLSSLSQGDSPQARRSPKPPKPTIYVQRSYTDVTSGWHLASRTAQSADNIQEQLNQQSTNPGLYVDQVLHKVFMNITETGTEAASVTSLVVDKIAGNKVTMKVDVPFIFFIRHEETKAILFWGSITVPTPNFR